MSNGPLQRIGYAWNDVQIGALYIGFFADSLIRA
jgi:hypothetical protein